MSENKYAKSYAEQVKGKTGVRRIINAAFYSIEGLKAAWSESAFRQLCLLHPILILLAFIFSFDNTHLLLLIFASFFSLIVELLNTAIEAAVDHTSLAKHELAKRAKDVGSAAQMLALFMIAILWGVSLLALLN